MAIETPDVTRLEGEILIFGSSALRVNNTTKKLQYTKDINTLTNWQNVDSRPTQRAYGVNYALDVNDCDGSYVFTNEGASGAVVLYSSCSIIRIKSNIFKFQCN